MLKLIQNEYIKLLKKKSTWAILIIVALLAVGFCAIFTLSMSVGTDSFRYNYSLKDEAESFLSRSYITQYEEKDSSGEYRDTSRDAHEIRQQAVYYRFVLENELEREDWRISTGLVSTLTSYKYLSVGAETLEERQEASVEYNKLKAEFDSDDWKSYYRAQLVQLKDAYKDDPLNLEASSWFYEYSIENDIKPGVEAWKDEALMSATQAKTSLVPLLKREAAGEKIDTDEKEKYLNAAAIDIYRLDHNVKNNIASEIIGESYNIDTMWGVFTQSKLLVMVLGVLIIVVAGSIVSSEFAQGTIKFLLINPVKRWKILVSKYITAISYGVILLLVLFTISGMSSMIFTGFAGITDKLLIAKNGVVRSASPIAAIMKQYLLSGINVIVMATLAFALSSVARSSALAVSISMLSLLVGNILIEILAALQLDWARYLIFANLNLEKVNSNQPHFVNQSFPLAIFIVAMHLIIFFMIAWDGFTRREV